MRSLIRFGISGAAATLTHLLLFIALVEWAHLRPVFAAVPSFLAAVLVSYGLNYYWTFTADGPHRVMLPRFALLALAGLGLNLLVTYAVVDVLGLWYGYALAVIVTLIPVATFLVSRRWVFRH